MTHKMRPRVFGFKSLLVLTLFGFSGCSHRPKSELATNPMNGETYDGGTVNAPPDGNPVSAAIALGVATGAGLVANNQKRQSEFKIVGQVFYGNGIDRITLRNEKVVLKQADKVIADTKTSLDGKFVIYRELPVGEYFLVLQSEKYSGQSRILIDKFNPAPVIMAVTTKK